MQFNFKDFPQKFNCNFNIAMEQGFQTGICLNKKTNKYNPAEKTATVLLAMCPYCILPFVFLVLGRSGRIKWPVSCPATGGATPGRGARGTPVGLLARV
jgi:hypothetical protein